MTAAIPTKPLTALEFLFGDAQDHIEALTQTLDQRGLLGSLDAALQQVSQAGRSAAQNEIVAVTHGLLNLDLVDFVVAGWRKYADLAEAADRTAANPGSSQVVDLATHHITSVHRPSIELLVNNVPVATVDFELQIELVVKALVVTVRNGHIVSLLSGACDLTATLSAESVQLASRQAHLQPPQLIRLPLRIHRGGDPLPHGAKHPPPWSRFSRRRTPSNHRQHRRQLVRWAPPAD